MLAHCPPRLKPPTFASIWIASRFASYQNSVATDAVPESIPVVHDIAAHC